MIFAPLCGTLLWHPQKPIHSLRPHAPAVFWFLFFFFFDCTTWHAGSYFPDQDQTQTPYIGKPESLSH